jgi:hypothetical protein
MKVRNVDQYNIFRKGSQEELLQKCSDIHSSFRVLQVPVEHGKCLSTQEMAEHVSAKGTGGT